MSATEIEPHGCSFCCMHQAEITRLKLVTELQLASIKAITAQRNALQAPLKCLNARNGVPRKRAVPA